jgi:hypothetical protein
MRVGMVAALQSRAEQGSFVYSTEKRATASGHETQKLLNKLRYCLPIALSLSDVCHRQHNGVVYASAHLLLGC